MRVPTANEVSLEAATEARAGLERERDAYKRLEMEAFQKRLNDAIRERWGDAINEAYKVEWAARDLVERDREQAATADTGMGFPVGTVLIQWALGGRTWDRDRKLAPTGKRGIVEVITAESEHPGNLRGYSRAKRGDVVLRLLKKDGSKGIAYESNRHAITNRWFPEGVNPNDAKEEKAA